MTDRGPALVAEWTRIVEYEGRHLNDFCLFRALDYRWHAIGIMGRGTWESETSLFHCSAPDLFGPYTQHPPLLGDLEPGDTDNARPQVHAPYVVVRDGEYHLFVRRPWGTNLRLRSRDPYRWPTVPEVVFEAADARDACIRLFDGVYHWYYVQRNLVDGVGRSCVMLRKSQDLGSWSDAMPAFVDTTREVRHSRLESPFVVEHAGRYWLLVRDRNREGPDHRAPVTVWLSDRPDRFAGKGDPVAVWPDVQSPEVVRANGRTHLARVSGVSHAAAHAPDDHGWIEVAEITWPG